MFPLTVEQLRKDVADKKIDTVVIAMTDMQGRLVGKRIDANFFLSDVFKHGTEGCNLSLIHI